MDLNPIILSIPVFFTLIVIEWLYDFFKKENGYRVSDAIGNIGCGIFEQTTGLLLKVFTVGIYAFVYQFHIFEIPHTFGYAFLLFLGVDFLYYWAHRMSHEVNLLWLGHVVHHQSEDYNLSVALRQGAVQKVFTAPFYLPLAIIGFEPEWFVYILAWNTLYQFWIHTEKINKLGPLEWILNTPSHHRVHHGRNPKYIDKNHAATLIIWDKMFGTFQAEEERPTYGITKPVNSFNPIKAHVKPFTDLFKETESLTFMEKVKLLFAPPGWRPKRLGGREYAPEIDQPLKYRVSLSIGDRKALLARFILILGLVASFLFQAPNLDPERLILGVITVIFAMYVLGSEASNKPPHWSIQVLFILTIIFWWVVNWMIFFAGLYGVALILTSEFNLHRPKASRNPSS